jgi:AcrR family transcriptional regulator
VVEDEPAWEAHDGRRRRGEESRAAARSLILAESRRVLRSGTVFDLTIQLVAQNVGLSRVTVYRYFPTVRDILKALSEEKIGQIFNNLPEAAASERRYLEEFVSLALKVFLDDSRLVRNLVLATEMGDAVNSLFRAELEELLRNVVEQLDPEVRPVSSDPAIAARIMVTYFRGALYGWAAGFIDDGEFAAEVRRASTLTSAIG